MLGSKRYVSMLEKEPAMLNLSPSLLKQQPSNTLISEALFTSPVQTMSGLKQTRRNYPISLLLS